MKITLSPFSEATLLFDGPKLPEVEAWFESYLRKDPLPLSLDLQAMPPFSQAVLRALQTVPFGETTTYGELARLAGHPKAARAVGQVCHRNPFPLVIPCHRVLSASGLGGFACGSALKQTLLAFEKAL